MRAWCLVVALVTVGLGVLVGDRTAHAGDPTQDWWTIESEHFVIHYYDPNLDLARKVAVAAERAHRVLAPVLRHSPPDKTIIVIVDDTDGANGFASVLPRNSITLFATAPSATSTLNDHDDWLYGLVAHEYVHILHLDTIGGLPRYYNKLFGKIWAPNQIQPRWFIEGLATYEESKRSSSGRVRSSIFDMYLRMAVLADVPIELDGMSTGPLAWPQGNVFYLYGSHFLAYIADRYGDDKLTKISHEYGRNPVPFALNLAVKRSLGKDYLELYDEWLAHMRKKYALTRDAVERRGRREGRQLTQAGQSNGSPRYTKDGRAIVWLRADGRQHAAYWTMPSGKSVADARELVEIDAGGALSMLPGDAGFVIERGNVWRSHYSFGDLYRFDRRRGDIVRVTKGVRAADPAVSPDGKRVAFTINGRSRLRLALMRLDQEAPSVHVIWQGEGRFDQAFTPAWSPDGKQLVFSAWTTGGYRDLWLLDVDTRAARPLMHDRAIDTDPVWTPDGRWIVFASDRTGIYNLYALAPATGELRQVTNVLGGTFAPDVSPDGTRVVYQGFDHKGFQLFEMRLDPAAWTPAEPYVNDRPPPTDLSGDGVWISEPVRYDPLPTLGPNTWQAQLVADSFGSAVTIQTNGSDAIGRHAWALGATFGIGRADLAVAASYGYGRLWPSLRLSGSRSVYTTGGLVIDGVNTAYEEEVWSASASVGLPLLRHPSMSGDLAFSYSADWIRRLSDLPPPQPDTSVMRLPETGLVTGLGARWSMSNVERAQFVHGPIKGWSFTAGARYNSPELGGRFRTLELTYRWQQFFQMPYAWSHTVSLRLTGGIEETDRRRDGGYVIGGLGTMNIVQAITDGLRAGTTGVLRGYEPGLLRGRHFHLLNAEYRFPLLTIERGFYTLPIYVRRLHGALLLDAGWAGREIAWEPIRPAVGGVLRLDAVFGFYEGGSFELGAMKGLDDDGRFEWWFLLAGGI